MVRVESGAVWFVSRTKSKVLVAATARSGSSFWVSPAYEIRDVLDDEALFDERVQVSAIRQGYGTPLKLLLEALSETA